MALSVHPTVCFLFLFFLVFHLDEIVEAKFLLVVETANLHQALGEEDEPQTSGETPNGPGRGK
jgi:hypothetical protein